MARYLAIVQESEARTTPATVERADEKNETNELTKSSPVARYAATLAPGVRFTVTETEDVVGDIAWLARVRAVLQEWPGDNHIDMRVVTLEGKRPVVRWRALDTRELRRALAQLLVERALTSASSSAGGVPPPPPASTRAGVGLVSDSAPALPTATGSAEPDQASASSDIGRRLDGLDLSLDEERKESDDASG